MTPRYDPEAINRAFTALGAATTLDRLGVTHRRDGQRCWFVCPWHADRSPSATLQRGPEGTLRAHCYACQATADVLGLAAAAWGLSAEGPEFRDVLARAAGLAGVGPMPEGYAPPRRPELPPEPLVYAPAGEVEALLAACGPVSADPTIAAVLGGRGISPGLVDDLGLARAISHGANGLPRWSRCAGLSWADGGYRLVLPTMGVKDGVIGRLGVRAWKVEGPPDDRRKRVAPAGFATAGLFLADPHALTLLGQPTAAKFVVTEGEPDFLSLATVAALEGRDYGVLGIVAGSWTPGLAALVPAGSVVAICTHDDTSGDAYAKTIAASAGDRFATVRCPPPEGGDLNDLHQSGGLASFDPFAALRDPPAPEAGPGEVDFAPGSSAWIEQFAAGRPQNEPISSGFYDLDDLLHGGYRAGDFCVLAGRTSQGKTSALLSMMGGHLVHPRGRGAQLFSVETTHDDFFARVFARATGIALSRLRGKDPGQQHELTRLVEAGAVLAKRPFRAREKRMTVEEIAGRVRAFHGDVRRRGERLGIVGVDYVQRLKKSNPRHDEREHVMHVCAELKDLAMIEGVAVIALSQVSRRVEERNDKRPTLADLKESGSLEEDADEVIGVFRPGYYDKKLDPSLAEFLVLKNRHGPVGVVNVRWQTETASYHDDYVQSAGAL